MALRHRAAKLLREGCGLDEIAARLGKPIEEVIQYLQLQAGEGDIKVSEIFFAILPEKRQLLERVIEQSGTSSPAQLRELRELKSLKWHEIDRLLSIARSQGLQG